ncbi:MAG: cytochrome C oxidase subunit I [Deltaproteobacteria bacterium GWA2_38_16]|nr:MAG: cytochrome C oxidase subunit I [Deltaproteobacteria bacterium GWA2_38_16]OGQ02209.1 MAG: cytochrome C oxidase subunit I [Deltaproteobacteria bacterium RIFCSPHIGHO2_02_FULL_38_15]OGQ60632.1 MAG: cytochrome C oxidase subunit I [Deltaproteobacteria bacterium RIFCSPLOWO2_12_FULL_38_8]HBQ22002.1 cytochrome C oxidase subunit I [Deltaproteobacteria bacterium]
MKIEKSFRRLILIELLFPILLLVLGIYHGFIQVLYRAGVIQSTSFLGLDYYQGLTLHGVVNAIVFTTFFAVAFGHALILFYLKKTPHLLFSWISGGLMVLGTLLASYAILSGKASVLYTFYPPLKAHPLFYIGATLLVIGSWIAFFAWIPLYRSWRKENANQKTPLAIVGIFSTFLVWLMATLPLAYEVLVMLIPWSLGFVPTVNVMLARTLFWFFGHPLVYFWLLPAYIMFYVMLPKVSGGKLYSDFAGRFVFMCFIILSAPVGLHHQFTDPAIRSSWKWFHTVLTFGIAIPSFMTFFTLCASLEYAAKSRGGTGLLRWWTKLPYFNKDNHEQWLFPYFISGLILFSFGGITGLINASYTMNSVIHNTSWVPGHFHTTVGGPVFLSFIAMSLFMVARLLGKEIQFPKLNMWVPYLWMVGVLTFSIGMSVAGIYGVPRRTNLGISYMTSQPDIFRGLGMLWSNMSVLGGGLMSLSMVFFFFVFITTLCSKKKMEGHLYFPTSETYYDENISFVQNFKPWIIIAIVLIVIAYGLPLYDVIQATFYGSAGFTPQSPLPTP